MFKHDFKLKPNVSDSANIDALFLVTLLEGCRKGGQYNQQARNETAQGTRRHICATTNDVSWGAFFTHGLVQAVVGLIIEDGLCGYPKAEVHHWAIEPHRYMTQLRYAFDLISIFMVFMDRLPMFFDRAGAGGDLVSYREPVCKAVDFVLAHSRRYWSVMYEFRDVFFSPAVRKGLEAHPQKIDDVLSLTALKMILLQKNLDRLRPDTHVECILLLVWIHAKGVPIRKPVFQTLESLLRTRSETNKQAYVNFYTFATTHVTSADDITRCLCRDYRSEQYIDEDANILTPMLVGLRPEDSMLPRPLKTNLDYQLFHSVLAASRRQMCRGNNDRSAIAISYLSMLRYIHNVVTSSLVHTDRSTNSKLSECSIHSIISFLGMMYLLTISDTVPQSEAQIWKETMDHCVRALEPMRRQTKRPSLKLTAMRWCTIGTCRLYIKAVQDNPVLNQPEFRDISHTWHDLLRATSYPKLNVDDTFGQFSVLERCAWGSCMCYFHKPAHRMRVCEGCWNVAYCGAQCQQRDWEQGDHKEKCRRLNYARMS